MEENESMNVGQKSELIIEAIREKKGHEIVTIDLSQVGKDMVPERLKKLTNQVTQVGAITESIAKILKENAGIRVHHIEGLRNSQWVLLDFFDVLVHVFLEEYRSFFKLEELWADGKVVKAGDL